LLPAWLLRLACRRSRHRRSITIAAMPGTTSCGIMSCAATSFGIAMPGITAIAAWCGITTTGFVAAGKPELLAEV
jgi:hypothetical protein